MLQEESKYAGVVRQCSKEGVAVTSRGSPHTSSASSDKDILDFHFVFRTNLGSFRSLCGATYNTANKSKSLF